MFAHNYKKGNAVNLDSSKGAIVSTNAPNILYNHIMLIFVTWWSYMKLFPKEISHAENISTEERFSTFRERTIDSYPPTNPLYCSILNIALFPEQVIFPDWVSTNASSRAEMIYGINADMHNALVFRSYRILYWLWSNIKCIGRTSKTYDKFFHCSRCNYYEMDLSADVVIIIFHLVIISFIVYIL